MPAWGRCAARACLLGLEVRGERRAARRDRARSAIINRLAARARVLIGYEGPDASMLKLRPPMPFRREHADRLVAAIDAAAALGDRSASQA